MSDNLPMRRPQYQVPMRLPPEYVADADAYPLRDQRPRELMDPGLRDYLPAPRDDEAINRKVVMPAAHGRNTMYSVQGQTCYVDNSTRVQVVVKREWSKNLMLLAIWAIGLVLFFAWLNEEIIPTVKRRTDPALQIFDLPLHGHPMHYPAAPGGRRP